MQGNGVMVSPAMVTRSSDPDLVARFMWSSAAGSQALNLKFEKLSQLYSSADPCEDKLRAIDSEIAAAKCITDA